MKRGILSVVGIIMGKVKRFNIRNRVMSLNNCEIHFVIASPPVLEGEAIFSAYQIIRLLRHQPYG